MQNVTADCDTTGRTSYLGKECVYMFAVVK